MIDISTNCSCNSVGVKHLGVGSLPPRAFRRRFVRYLHIDTIGNIDTVGTIGTTATIATMATIGAMTTSGTISTIATIVTLLIVQQSISENHPGGGDRVILRYCCPLQGAAPRTIPTLSFKIVA